MVDPMMIQGVTGDPTVYLNGEFLPLSGAKISVLDRGFIFGDGIYDVVPVYNRKPFRMANHLARLESSLKQIGIASPLTRAGKAAREKGLRAVSIPDDRWLHCDIKSVSLLGNVLAKQAAVQAGVDEVIQFRGDRLTEGASCNIWVVKNGRLIAPPKDNLVLEGIRYGLLEELARDAGIPFELRPVTRAEVADADELMISSATREVLPVVELDGKPVGAGVPGPVYGRLRQAYDAQIDALK